MKKERDEMFGQEKRNRRKKSRVRVLILINLFILSNLVVFAHPAYAADTELSGMDVDGEETASQLGGGYSASGQLPDVGIMPVLYDAKNGLPTSEANYVLGASDGYIWIGGYSGVLKYDGSDFERLDSAEGLTNGRGLFEDSTGRIWVATNDNGVVVIDERTQTHFTRADGLGSSSVRTFAEDLEGNVYIGTTAGVCCVDKNLKLHRIQDPRIKEERILKLDSDTDGKIYGYTKTGAIFSISKGERLEYFESADLGLEKITFLMADRENAGKVYLGTDSDAVYYGSFGFSTAHLKRIRISPLESVKWIAQECGCIWVASEQMVGYLDEKETYHVLPNLPVNDSIEMLTSDYQGNLWIASSRQGVMKIVSNHFMNYTEACGIPDEVVNAACLYREELYVGCDTGLHVISANGMVLENELTRYIGDARVRHIMADSAGNLWVATFTNDLGLVCMTEKGKLRWYTTKNGMPGNEIRCVMEASDGSIVCGTNTGVAFIKDGKVIRTLGTEEGLSNLVILTLAEVEDGKIYAGTDGDGIYVIDQNIDKNAVTRLGEEDGLTSDVVIRIRNDKELGISWIITSNSIEYWKDGIIKNVSTFPYSNNFDLYPDRAGNLWVLSSQGVYCVKTEEMLGDSLTNYRLYTLANGLTSLPVANCYSALDEGGNLYIAGQTGVSKVNIENFYDGNAEVITKIKSVFCDEQEIFPDADGSYTIPKKTGRTRIMPAVLDYSMQNLTVRVFLEGSTDQGNMLQQTDLYALEYTDLAYGDYILHIQTMKQGAEEVLSDETFQITKEPGFFELIAVRALLVVLFAVFAGLVVWRVMLGTVVRRQYIQIREAKEEAEQANLAKSRFLANMSHEIRTPINTILGMNEMILREDVTDVPKPYFMSIVGYALDVKNATESLLSLINDLLDISKIESGKMHLVEQEYEPEALLRSVIAMIRVRSEAKKLYFDVNVDETLPKRLYGDEGKIKQIILNLLTNAVKYTEEGGFTLQVTVTEKTELSCQLRISVKDTGKGVKEEDLGRLFTAYERLDEVNNSGIQGTGLGLDISRQFTELMNGRLWCESVYGEGSEFILTVSQKIADPTEIGVFQEEEDLSARGPYVPQFVAPDADILIVDDNPMNLTVIKGLLKPTKVFVTIAESGWECLEKLETDSFNVVFLDHMMPGMDGIETLQKIREKHPDLPVYALTANVTAGGDDFYKSKGFNGYLAKPIDTVAVERAIMRHLPEEIMQKPSQEDAVKQDTGLQAELSWLNEVEGISAADGIKNSGGVSAYVFSLNLFLDTIEDNAGVLENALKAGDLKLFTIKVHALKSSARIIGAMEFSAFCQELENAGNAGDEKYIQDHLAKLFSDYRDYKDKLGRLKEKEEVTDKDPIPQEELTSAYEALREVVPQMDYDAVEMILEQLKCYQLPVDELRKIQKLERLLRTFEWDAMEEMIKEKLTKED